MGVPISNVTRRVVYAASGTGPYAFTFEILANTDIAVYKDDTLLTLTTDYTVTIASNGTGSITLVASPTGATQIAIVGNRTIQRTTDFVTGGDFFANTVNDEMDQQTIFAQQNAEGLQRALQAPQTDPTSINMTLPRKADRAGKYLAFDADGNPEPGPTSANVDDVAAIYSEIVTVAGIASDVTAVAGNNTNITAVKNNATNINTVAGASANVNTVATNISAINTNASNITAIQNAATNATNAATSATNAATSASSASTSATNASNSANVAAMFAAAASTALDSFDDRYLGTKSSDPTVDNDGNALVTGALYYNTTTQMMKVYDGANWIAATAAGTTSMLVYKYVATAGQTTFSGAATVGGTMSYTSGNIIVFLNGAALDSTDYTATNGTSVVLASAASLNDELVVVAFKSFTVADALAKTGGTLSGDLTLDNGNADGAQLVLNSSGYSSWNLDNYSGRLRAYYGSTEYFTINSSGNVGIGTISPSAANKLQVLSTVADQGFAVGGASKQLRLSYDNTGNYGKLNAADYGTGQTSLKYEALEHIFGAGVFSAPERMRIDSSGNLLVSKTADTDSVAGTVITLVDAGGAGKHGKIKVTNTVGTGQYVFQCLNASGSTVGGVTSSSTATAFPTSSDYRLKENVQPMTGALSVVSQLKPCTYTWKADGSDGQGFIAHELQEVCPDAVVGEKDAVDADGNPVYQGIDTSFLVATLTAAIQEQQAIIQTLTARIEAFEGQV